MDLDLYLFDRLIAHTEPMSRGAKMRIIYEESVGERYPAETSLLSCSIPTGSRSEPAAVTAVIRIRARRLLDGEPMGGIERRWLLDDSSGQRRGENLDQATLSDRAAQCRTPT